MDRVIQRSVGRRAGLSLVAALLVSRPSIAAGANDAQKGYFGFELSIDADGIFNPKINSVKVRGVTPGMPAAAAGIAAGDEVLAINGTAVPGAKAGDLRPFMERSVGDKALFRMRRADGSAFEVQLTAVARARPAAPPTP